MEIQSHSPRLMKLLLYLGYAVGLFPWALTVERNPKSYLFRIPSLLVGSGLLAAFMYFVWDYHQTAFYMETLPKITQLSSVLEMTCTVILSLACILDGLSTRTPDLHSFLPKSPRSVNAISVIMIVLLLAGYVAFAVFAIFTSPMRLQWNILRCLILSYHLIVSLVCVGSFSHYKSLYDDIQPSEQDPRPQFCYINRKISNFTSTVERVVAISSITSAIQIFIALYYCLGLQYLGLQGSPKSDFIQKTTNMKLSVSVFLLLHLCAINFAAWRLERSFESARDLVLVHQELQPEKLFVSKKLDNDQLTLVRLALNQNRPTIGIVGFFNLGMQTLSSFIITIVTFLAILVQILQAEKASK